MGLIARLAALLTVLTLLATAIPALAGSPVNADDGIALHGYDPVAYFRGAGPKRGDPAITSTHEGVVYRFASRRNKARFDRSPGRYIPQFGGFCTYAVANGRKADIDPHAYAIRDGKLYVNYSLEVQKTFDRSPGSYIRSANRNWPTVRLQDEVVR